MMFLKSNVSELKYFNKHFFTERQISRFTKPLIDGSLSLYFMV